MTDIRFERDLTRLIDYAVRGAAQEYSDKMKSAEEVQWVFEVKDELYEKLGITKRKVVDAAPLPPGRRNG